MKPLKIHEVTTRTILLPGILISTLFRHNVLHMLAEIHANIEAPPEQVEATSELSQSLSQLVIGYDRPRRMVSV